MAFSSTSSITDPLDFQSSTVPRLYEIDLLLRCHICKEFMVAPMLTTCGHSFCSMCIRKYLIHTPQCPICSKELRESHLSKNVIIEQIVISYRDIRQDLLNELTRKRIPPCNGSVANTESQGQESGLEVIDVDELESDHEEEDEVQIIEEQTRKRKQPSSKSIDELFKRKRDEPKPTVPTGVCPICQKNLPLRELQTTHIDECLATPQPASTASLPVRSISADPPSLPGSSPSTSLAYFLPKESSKSYLKLKKLDFSSLSTSALKSSLTKLDLPITGTRHQLETRYNEYMILWNANTDSVMPKDPRVLRRQLAQWESSLKFKVSSRKQLDKDGWDELIAMARSTAHRNKKVKEEVAEAEVQSEGMAGISHYEEGVTDAQHIKENQTHEDHGEEPEQIDTGLSQPETLGSVPNLDAVTNLTKRDDVQDLLNGVFDSTQETTSVIQEAQELRKTTQESIITSDPEEGGRFFT